MKQGYRFGWKVSEQDFVIQWTQLLVLTQHAQTKKPMNIRKRIIEYPQANLFNRSICFLVWATLASFWKPSRSVYMRQTINFDEINVSNRHVYYPVNTCIRIALISSLINGFSRTNCQPWVHLKGVEETPLSRLAGASLKLSIER